MTRRHQTQPNIQKILKEYMVPLIALALLIILAMTAFGGSSDTSLQDTVENENRVGMNIALASPATEAYVVYPDDSREVIDTNTPVYKGEKILVKEGSLKATLTSVGDIALSKLAEFRYEENGDFSMFS